MKITCKNCGYTFQGNFCNNCGQESNIKKLNFHFLWSDIQQGMFNLNRGILFTLRQMCTRPGHAIRDFIDGKRVNYTQPISFVIILATVYGVLYYYFRIDLSYSINPKNSSPEIIDVHKLNEFISLHYAWFTLATIPLLGLSSHLIFKRQPYTFFEHLVLNAYLAGQRIFLQVVLFPVLLFFHEKPGIKTYVWLTQLFDILLIIWGYTQFFSKRKKITTILLAIVSYIFFLLFIFIVELLAIIIFEIIKR